MSRLSHQEQVEISQYIAEIYKHSRVMEVNEFRQYCLDGLQNFIEFDAALWFNRLEHELAFNATESFDYQLPNNFIENYNECISMKYLDEDPIAKMVTEQPNTVISYSDVFQSKEEFLQSKLYLLHCKKFALSDVLTSWVVNDINKKVNVIALYKLNKNEIFSEKDKEIKSILDDHYASAMSINIMSVLSNQFETTNVCRAIADNSGNILEAEDAFIEKLSHHNNSNINNITLPKLTTNEKVEYILPDETIMTLTLRDNLVLLEISKDIQLSSMLTPKQIIVCDLLNEGLTDKGIANKIGISPFTVRNHLKEIYKRLGTKNRVGTLAFLMSNT